MREPGLLKPLLSGRGERDVELAAVGGADPCDEPVAFHAVQQPGDAAAAERVGDDHAGWLALYLGSLAPGLVSRRHMSW